MRHRIKYPIKGKVAVKHSSCLVDNVGQGTATIFPHIIFQTDVGARALTGGVQTIRNEANTENDCNIGDTIKYVNICLEASPRGANPTNDNDNAGWLEWAIVYQKERSAVPTTANLGVCTLGVVCSHAFREDCLMTGCFPLGTKQAMAQDIKIKIPERCQQIKMGSILRCFCHVRTSSSTDVRTDSHRLMASSHFKVYS